MGTLPLQYVDVDGLRIAYREAGQGPAVLLVHGWPTSSYLWRAVMPAVAARSGSGRSPSSTRWPIRSCARRSSSSPAPSSTPPAATS